MEVRFNPPKVDPPQRIDPHDIYFVDILERGEREGGVALFGVPFDGGVISRPGARLGPESLRNFLYGLKPTRREGDPPRGRLSDWGDLHLSPLPIPQVHEIVLEGARKILRRGALPVAVGGDHSITFPLVEAQVPRSLGLVNLDAHLDIREVVGGVLNSGQSIGRIVEQGWVSPDRVVEVGIRELSNSPFYLKKARDLGIHILFSSDWREDPQGTIREALEIASRGTEGTYLTIDIDVLDEGFAPGVSAPTSDGIDPGLLVSSVRRIAREGWIVGADLVELSPPHDDGRTARAAAFVLGTLLLELAAKSG